MSQLFANVYMNEFDQFIKHKLGVKHYVRYTDDFVLVAESREYLESSLYFCANFLEEKLVLTLHPKKVIIRQFHEGIDFLGLVIFPKHRLVRTKTWRRILKKMGKRINEHRLDKISELAVNQTLQSYLGVLSHANAYKASKHLKNQLWF